jgi:hypothetical protein
MVDPPDRPGRGKSAPFIRNLKAPRADRLEGPDRVEVRGVHNRTRRPAPLDKPT